MRVVASAWGWEDVIVEAVSRDRARPDGRDVLGCAGVRVGDVWPQEIVGSVFLVFVLVLVRNVRGDSKR